MSIPRYIFNTIQLKTLKIRWLFHFGSFSNKHKVSKKTVPSLKLLVKNNDNRIFNKICIKILFMIPAGIGARWQRFHQMMTDCSNNN